MVITKRGGRGALEEVKRTTGKAGRVLEGAMRASEGTERGLKLHDRLVYRQCLLDTPFFQTHSNTCSMRFSH